MDTNSRSLEIKIKVNLKLFLSKQKLHLSLQNRFSKYVREYGFLSFATSMSNKYGKQILDTATKSISKASEATCEFFGKNVADKILKPKSVPEGLQFLS